MDSGTDHQASSTQYTPHEFDVASCLPGTRCQFAPVRVDFGTDPKVSSTQSTSDDSNDADLLVTRRHFTPVRDAFRVESATNIQVSSKQHMPDECADSDLPVTGRQITSARDAFQVDSGTVPQVSSMLNACKHDESKDACQVNSETEPQVSTLVTEPRSAPLRVSHEDSEIEPEVTSLNGTTQTSVWENDADAVHSFATLHISRGTAPDITQGAPDSQPLQENMLTPIEIEATCSANIADMVPDATSDIIIKSLTKIVKRHNATAKDASNSTSSDTENNITSEVMKIITKVPVNSASSTELSVTTTLLDLPDATPNGTYDDILPMTVPDKSTSLREPSTVIVCDPAFISDIPEASNAVASSTPSPASEALPSVVSVAHASRLTPVRGSGRVLPYTLFKSLVCCFAPHTATH